MLRVALNLLLAQADLAFNRLSSASRVAEIAVVTGIAA